MEECFVNDRLRFFSEMKKGLLETVKAVSEPLIEEKITQIDRVTDSILQIKWVLLTDHVAQLPSVEQRMINGEQVIVFRTGEEVKAISNICPVCSNLFHFFESTNKVKCFMCEKEYFFFSGEGELPVTFYPIRKKDSHYEIGIRETKRL